MTTDWAKSWEKEIRTTWFPNHVAEVLNLATDTGPTIIQWRNPGTTIYLVRYLLYSNSLIVLGDIGTAIYKFDCAIDVDFFDAMSVDYFSSKCSASEFGLLYRSWCVERAKDSLKNWIADGSSTKEIESRRRALVPSAFQAAENEGSWRNWLGIYGRTVFGYAWYTYADVGSEVDIRCMGHLIGLQMANEQLKVGMRHA